MSFLLAGYEIDLVDLAGPLETGISLERLRSSALTEDGENRMVEDYCLQFVRMSLGFRNELSPLQSTCRS